ncbi:hypothetical protein EGR_07715 [Echinococcus granulosus]|uniref:Uncharacterized protein n=1 Tax=Echinococcus granulosus TaxID=6210 RepID=W6UA45_ECHGR|nr:hypothetical protein EGR_07715 [Echinococcus granulosus]EUB57391.1 hypothetical protein EGR_07715 [Echinococcus granulosus]
MKQLATYTDLREVNPSTTTMAVNTTAAINAFERSRTLGYMLVFRECLRSTFRQKSVLRTCNSRDEKNAHVFTV